MCDHSGDGVGGAFSCEWAFRRTSKHIREYDLVVFYVVIGDVFCVYVESFKCVKVWFFLWCLNICIVLWMVLNGWLCSMRCWTNFDVWVLALNAC